jgi:hypothetical protein
MSSGAGPSIIVLLDLDDKGARPIPLSDSDDETLRPTSQVSPRREETIFLDNWLPSYLEEGADGVGLARLDGIPLWDNIAGPDLASFSVEEILGHNTNMAAKEEVPEVPEVRAEVPKVCGLFTEGEKHGSPSFKLKVTRSIILERGMLVRS